MFLNDGDNILPNKFDLSQNYPNPFNPTTRIDYSVVSDGHVTLNVYDITGRLVSTLVDGYVDAGYHSVMWNGVDNKGELVEYSIGTIETNTTIFLEFNIVTKENTKEGTYFVRFAMDFEYNGTARSMQSRGHWNMELWEEATTNVTEGSPGNINLEVLGVDGIIPDSSFGVKKPIPKWPLYALITLTIVFAGLSVIFYLEEEGNYPELNKWLQKQRGKLNELRLRFKYRKGS